MKRFISLTVLVLLFSSGFSFTQQEYVLHGFFKQIEIGDYAWIVFTTQDGTQDISCLYDEPFGPYLIVNIEDITDQLLTITYVTREEYLEEAGGSIELNYIQEIYFGEHSATEWWEGISRYPEMVEEVNQIVDEYFSNLGY